MATNHASPDLLPGEELYDALVRKWMGRPVLWRSRRFDLLEYTGPNRFTHLYTVGGL